MWAVASRELCCVVKIQRFISMFLHLFHFRSTVQKQFCRGGVSPPSVHRHRNDSPLETRCPVFFQQLFCGRGNPAPMLQIYPFAAYTKSSIMPNHLLFPLRFE